MPAVKKVEQKIIQLIGETEAIFALEILLRENELIYFGGKFHFHLSDRTKDLRELFYETYNRDCAKVVYEGIVPWIKYIFTTSRIYLSAEIYRKYAECMSLLDKQ